MFGASRLVNRDVEAWLLDRFVMLHEKLGPQRQLCRTLLVLPKLGTFVVEGETDREMAESIFRTVAEYAGMADWHVELEGFESAGTQQVSEYHFLTPQTARPAGTFSIEGNSVLIRYDAGLVKQPQNLIATFAHELSHYLLAGYLPESFQDQDHELLTDLTAVYMGFGVFLANTAFEFEGNQGFTGTGWTSRRMGYLSEDTLLAALALFVRTGGHDPDEVRQHLKSGLVKRFDKGLKQVDRLEAQIAAIRDRDAGFAAGL